MSGFSGLFATDPVALFRNLLSLAQRYALPIIAAILLSVAAAVAITISTTPVYRAVGVIQIQPEEGRIVTVDEVVQNNAGNDSLAYYQTQYGLLRSRSLAQRVVTKVGATVILGAAGVSVDGLSPAAAREQATDKVLENVTVRPTTGSRLVSIEFQSTDTELASKVVDAYITEFIALTLERRFEASSYARNFLERRLNDLRTRLETTERELVAYADQADLVATEQGPDPSRDAGLEALVAARSQATQRRIEAEGRQDALIAQAGELPEVTANQTLQNLNTELVKARAEYREKRQVFGPEYPLVLQLAARVAAFEQQINARGSELRNSLVANARGQVDAARQVEAQLDSEIARVRNEARDIERRAINYNILRRELDTNKTLYDGLLQRYREIGLASGIGVNNISIVDNALVQDDPVRPRPLINLLLGLLSGLGLSGLIVLIGEQWSQSIRRPDDLTRLFNLPVIGIVPVCDLDKGVVEVLSEPRSEATEAYHSVRVGIQFATSKGLPKSLVTTSSMPGEGKTTTSVAIALLVARSGMRVALVDGDLRDPSLQSIFGVRNRSGFAELLAGSAEIADVSLKTVEPSLTLITAGSLPANAAELLSTPGARNAIAKLEDSFDLVVIDSAPVLGLADAPILASLAEKTLFVIGANRASKSLIRQSLSRLGSARIDLLGAVMTRFDARRESYGGCDYSTSYGSYAYGYGSESPVDGGAAASPGPAARSKVAVPPAKTSFFKRLTGAD